jgi:apolipoprotein D and lipocalin family protein
MYESAPKRVLLSLVLILSGSMLLSERAEARQVVSSASPAPTLPPLQTVPFVDVSKYLGTWFQISRVVLPFEGDCACAQQTLGLDSAKGVVTVYNSCNDKTPQGRLREIRGFATSDEPQTNAKFTVDFGLPQTGKYWIVALGANYEYAVVSDPDRKSLYILSKTPFLDSALYQEALNKASQQLDISRLTTTNHVGCSYPPEVVMPAGLPALAPFRSPTRASAFTILSTPLAPTDPTHPGSKVYQHTSSRQVIQCLGRETTVYLSSKKTAQALVAFGHGQALDSSHYEGTHEHLARKGIASVSPPYDTGFFDRNWNRMGTDYAKIVECVADAFPNQIDRKKVIYSGHSKGAYVAQIAAGIANQQKLSSTPKALVLFNPAGHDVPTLKSIDAASATTVVFSDQDSVVKRADSESIYKQSASLKKQFLTIKSYTTNPSVKADHFWTLTKPSTFGGGSESALHYYGSWKWLTAAADDLDGGGSFSNPFIYGRDVTEKGLGSSIQDERIANF